MANRIFYIEYYQNGNIFRQRIRRWADNNRNIFPEYGFTNSQSDFPTTNFIAHRLLTQYNFQSVVHGSEVIIFNQNRNFRF